MNMTMTNHSHLTMGMHNGSSHTMMPTHMSNHTGGHGHGHGHGHGTEGVHGTGHGIHTMGGHSGIGHMMYFSFSAQATILFKEWDIDSTKGMVWSCFVVFLMAILYEGFKVFREVLREKYGNPKIYDVTSNGHGPAVKSPYGDTTVKSFSDRFCNWHHFLQSFLHIIQVALSYFLMLIAMTFNGWLFIAVCVGAGFGYFLFSWRVSKSYDVNEHCH